MPSAWCVLKGTHNNEKEKISYLINFLMFPDSPSHSPFQLNSSAHFYWNSGKHINEMKANSLIKRTYIKRWLGWLLFLRTLRCCFLLVVVVFSLRCKNRPVNHFQKFPFIRHDEKAWGSENVGQMKAKQDWFVRAFKMCMLGSWPPTE